MKFNLLLRPYEFGLFIYADGSNRLYSFRILAPGGLHLQGLEFMSKGHLIADVVR